MAAVVDYRRYDKIDHRRNADLSQFELEYEEYVHHFVKQLPSGLV